MKLATNTRKGMSLPELIAVIIVIAIIGGIALNVISGLSSEAKESKGRANVAEINRLLSNVEAAGGTVAAGGTNDVDMTSTTTALTDLKTGFTPAGTGITLKLDDNFALGDEGTYAISDNRFTFTPNP